MLDSTKLNKILSTRHTDSPASQVIETTSGSKPDDSSSESHHEAEVRLVVRFTVEEHIVYRGKVQKVHQLDSEELTRTVSRVVWTGHDDCKVPSNEETVQDEQKERSPSPIVSVAQAIYPIEEAKICEKSQDQSSCKEKPSSPTQQKNDEEPTTSHLSSDNHPFSETLRDNKLNEEQAHATSPSITDSGRTLKVCDTNQSQQQFQATQHKQQQDPHSHQHHHNQNQQQFQHQYQSKINEDTTSKGIQLNSISIADNESTLTSLKPQNDIEVDLKIKPDIIFDPTAASPSILDALNECVAKVDSESQLVANSEFNEEDMKELFGQENENPTVLPNNTDRLRHQQNAKDHLVPDLDATYLSTDARAHPVPELSHEIIVEASPSKEAIARESNQRTSSTTVSSSTNSATAKRKQSSDGQTLKRVRRTDSKDQKSSKKRLKSTDSTENHTPINNPDRSTTANLVGEQFTRHSKIFAKWSDNHFYPGTIIKPAKDRKLVIGFYDGAQRTVSETDLIPLSNITGKQVRVTIGRELCLNAIVHGQRSSVNDQPVFDVEYRSGKEHVRKCVPIKDIFLTGEQGTPLINQPDRNSGASNFADVDLDNIIYEKRSRRLQEMDEFEGTENSSIGLGGKRKRSNHPTRSNSPKIRVDEVHSADCSDNDLFHDRAKLTRDLRRDSTEGLETLKTNLLSSNPPTENSNTTGPSKIPNPNVELGNKEFYFSNSSSPHRTNTSLLL